MDACACDGVQSCIKVVNSPTRPSSVRDCWDRQLKDERKKERILDNCNKVTFTLLFPTRQHTGNLIRQTSPNMKASLVLLAAAAGLTSAAQVMTDVLPECSHECLKKGISSGSNCKLEDSECLCEVNNYRNIYSAAEACALQACGAAKSIGMPSSSPRSLSLSARELGLSCSRSYSL